MKPRVGKGIGRGESLQPESTWPTVWCVVLVGLGPVASEDRCPEEYKTTARACVHDGDRSGRSRDQGSTRQIRAEHEAGRFETKGLSTSEGLCLRRKEVWVTPVGCLVGNGVRVPEGDVLGRRRCTRIVCSLSGGLLERNILTELSVNSVWGTRANSNSSNIPDSFPVQHRFASCDPFARADFFLGAEVAGWKDAKEANMQCEHCLDLIPGGAGRGRAGQSKAPRPLVVGSSTPSVL